MLLVMPNRTLRLCWIGLISALAVSAADKTWSWSEYRKAVITPLSAGRQLATAGIAQWTDTPDEWGQGMAGYGRRYADRVATHAVRGSIRYSVAYLRNEDIKYRPSGVEGKWARIKYAMKTTFIVPRIDGPGTTISTARFAGAYGGAGVNRLWHPADRRNVSSVLIGGTLCLGFDVGGHLIKEFWPRKNKGTQIKDPKR